MREFELRNRAVSAFITVVIVLGVLIAYIIYDFKHAENEEAEKEQEQQELSEDEYYNGKLGVESSNSVNGIEVIEVYDETRKLNAPTVKVIDKVKIEKRKAISYQQQALVNITFNKLESPLSIELNTYTYQVANDAVKSDIFKVHKVHKDPLIVLAQAATEFGGIQDGQDMWIPAMPTKYMDRKDWTLQNLQSQTYADILRYPQVERLQKSNRAFVGPLQLGYGYGTQRIPESKLNYSDEISSIQSDNFSLSYFNSNPWIQGERFTRTSPMNNKSLIGDRWNWNDATWNAVSEWSFNYSLLKGERKKLVTDNHNAFLAFIALQHNAGISIAVNDLDSLMPKVTRIYDGATFADLWNFIEWLGNEKVNVELELLAQHRIEDYRSGVVPNPSSHLTLQEFIRILDSNSTELSNYNEIREAVSSGKGKGYEIPMHAAKYILHYKILKLRYSGA